MKKRYLILVFFVILTILLGWGGVNLYQNYVYINHFNNNQKGEPYSRNVPLDEMDFEVYAEYFPNIHALIDRNYIKAIQLPCDVDYYLAPEDREPALTIKKGTWVNVIPDNANGFPIIGYGLQCWPDYIGGWRYGSPFYLGDVSTNLNRPAMYYVKSSQLEKVAESFYNVNKKQLSPYKVSVFTAKIIGYIDEILYNNGVFCAPLQ